MQIKIITALIAVLPIISLAQNFPLTIPPEEGSHNSGRIYSMPNGNILINNYVYSFSTGDFYTKLIALTSNGNIICEKKYTPGIEDVLIYSADSIYFIYTSNNEEPNNQLYIELVNANFVRQNIDSLTIYSNDCFRLKLYKQNDSIFFFANHFVNPAANIKLTLGNVTRNGSFSSNVKTIDFNSPRVSDILLSKQKEWYIFCNSNYIVRLDSNYSVINEYNFTFDGKIFNSEFNSFWLSDRFLITGGTAFDGLKVVKSDTSLEAFRMHRFETSDMYEYEFAGHYSNVVKADSFFYFVGTKGLDTTDSNYSSDYIRTYAFIACLDFDLNVKWEKKFGGDIYYVVYSVCKTINNECLLLASRSISDENNRTNNLYILKLDKYGNITTAVPVEKVNNKALIYPNPGKSILNIRLPENNEEAFINLYSVSGKKVLSQGIASMNSIVTTEHLDKGFYIYEIWNKSKLVDSGKWIKN